ncbi:MAG TPA: hypothetical protein VGJ25_05865 [Gaiellaceae bacterium]|jgi:hypothetical protein
MKRSYAVVWSSNADVSAGRLEPLADRFELYGRERRLSVPFANLTSASIARRRDDRLLGLPVLALALRGCPPLRIASLEGAGSLQELADRIEAGGRAVVAA